MGLNRVVTGRLQRPPRIVLYGPEKVGKSTTASEAPAPIFLGAEDGTSELDVARFPEPASWSDIMEAVRVLTVEPHEFRTLVLDTLDWAEPMCWTHICAREKKPSIEAFGYGKGYVAALDEWRLLLRKLDALREAKKMGIMLLAHAHVKTWKNPGGDDFDRWTMKLHDRAGGLIKEWADAVLFAQFETFTKTTASDGRAKAFSTGARIVHTTRGASYDAGNRYSMPEQLPLCWAEIDGAIRAGRPRELSALLEDADALLAQAPLDVQQKGRAWLTAGRNAQDAKQVAVFVDRLRAKLALETNGTPAEAGNGG